LKNIFIAVIIAIFLFSCDKLPDYVPEGYQLALCETFDVQESLHAFEFSQPDKWILSDSGNNSMALEFTGKSEKYQPRVRSPHTIGLISGLQFGSFVLEADLLQTGREYGHRDMCIFFGFQDSTHFYYAHMATSMDDHAHNIFIVNDEPRLRISPISNDGIDWGDNVWHKVRLVRDITTGTIELYYDDMTNPIMQADDKTFGEGYIGFGSFDDSGKIDNITIWSDKITEKPAGIFTSLAH
jgi:hypothetical protein